MSNNVTVAKFPKALLEKPIEEQKQHFYEKLVAHRAITNGREDLIDTLKNPIDGQIIIVVGPPGVGKSTIRRTFVRDIIKAFVENSEHNPSHLPIAGIELEGFQDGVFKWKKTRQEVLKAFHEPLIDKKVMYRQGIHDKQGELYIDTKISSDDLGEILIDVLLHRKPKALWFDEAQHLIKVSGAKGLLDQMDTIKSLANRSETPIILFGTYEMNSLLGLSPQLARRTKLIHIPRYRAKNTAKNAVKNKVKNADVVDKVDDVEEFKNTLLGFQRNLVFKHEPDLVGSWEYFFAGSCGCIGILKTWLQQASGYAQDKGLETLSKEVCDRWKIDTNTLFDMNQSMIADEIRFEQKRTEIEYYISMDLPVDSLEVDNVDTPEQEVNSSKVNTTAQRVQPGERNPTRDKLGEL